MQNPYVDWPTPFGVVIKNELSYLQENQSERVKQFKSITRFITPMK
jgi:hypothetical protein